MKEQRYNLIRGLGILSIILFHFDAVLDENGLSPTLFLNSTGTIQLGGIGVVLFFCLSGSLLIKNYRENFKVRSFIKKRLIRIYIPQFITYMLAFIIWSIVYSSIYTIKSIPGILVSLFGMDYFGGGGYYMLGGI